MFLVRNKNNKFNGVRNVYKTTFMKTFPKYVLLESTLRAVQELNRSVYGILLPKAKSFNESFNAIRNEIVFLDDVNFTSKSCILKNCFPESLFTCILNGQTDPFV